MVNNCGNCKHREVKGYEEPCSSCRTTSGGTPTKWEQQHTTQTNADRIRAMSDEELANWLARTQYVNMMEAAEIFGAQLPFEEETLNGSEQECLQWLKQPADMRGEEDG